MYLPDDARGRGAVVLCPPLGLEAVCARRTYCVLAAQLQAEGLAVLSFDYDGTGDSTGLGNDPDRLEAWRESILTAIELMHSCGAARVAAVGMRLGATIAASASRDSELAALVLWDPCENGRAYLREQQALRAVHLGNTGSKAFAEKGEVETLGDVYDAQTVRELVSLSIVNTEGKLADRVLVLLRPTRSAAPDVVERLTMEHVEWGAATGQEDLIGVAPGHSTVPDGTVHDVTQWLSSAFGPEPSAISVPHCETAVVHNPQHGEVVEQIVSLGAGELFGILAHTDFREGEVTAVLLNAGVIDHVGPARLWVQLSRQLAQAGLRVLRVDLSGLGDSPPRSDRQVDAAYPIDVFKDLDDISTVVPSPSDLIFMGLCSGGYHSIEAGMALGPRGVCAVNPILPRGTYWQPEPPNDRPTNSEPEPSRYAVASRRTWVRLLPGHDRLLNLADKLPSAAWWVFNRIGVKRTPMRTLKELVDNDVDTMVVCGEHEARLLSRGDGLLLRHLRRRSNFQLLVASGIDHELFGLDSRERVLPILTRYVLEHAVRLSNAIPEEGDLGGVTKGTDDRTERNTTQ